MSWDIRDGFDVIFADYQAPAGLCQSPGFSELCNHFLRLSQGQMFRPLLVHLTVPSSPVQVHFSRWLLTPSFRFWLLPWL